MSRAQRIERIVMGVLAKALRDACQTAVRIEETGPYADLLISWCTRGLAVADTGLPVSSLSKSALLLGETAQAGVFPFGDLYLSQLDELIGRDTPAQQQAVDHALVKFFDERRSWTEASAHLPESERAKLWDSIERGRFRRRQGRLIPKLGARTLGIDLYA
jgi:hypothetical protein